MKRMRQAKYRGLLGSLLASLCYAQGSLHATNYYDRGQDFNLFAKRNLRLLPQALGAVLRSPLNFSLGKGLELQGSALGLVYSAYRFQKIELRALLDLEGTALEVFGWGWRSFIKKGSGPWEVAWSWELAGSAGQKGQTPFLSLLQGLKNLEGLSYYSEVSQLTPSTIDNLPAAACDSDIEGALELEKEEAEGRQEPLQRTPLQQRRFRSTCEAQFEMLPTEQTEPAGPLPLSSDSNGFKVPNLKLPSKREPLSIFDTARAVVGCKAFNEELGSTSMEEQIGERIALIALPRTEAVGPLPLSSDSNGFKVPNLKLPQSPPAGFKLDPTASVLTGSREERPLLKGSVAALTNSRFGNMKCLEDPGAFRPSLPAPKGISTQIDLLTPEFSDAPSPHLLFLKKRMIEPEDSSYFLLKTAENFQISISKSFRGPFLKKTLELLERNGKPELKKSKLDKYCRNELIRFLEWLDACKYDNSKLFSCVSRSGNSKKREANSHLLSNEPLVDEKHYYALEPIQKASSYQTLKGFLKGFRKAFIEDWKRLRKKRRSTNIPPAPSVQPDGHALIELFGPNFRFALRHTPQETRRAFRNFFSIISVFYGPNSGKAPLKISNNSALEQADYQGLNVDAGYSRNVQAALEFRACSNSARALIRFIDAPNPENGFYYSMHEPESWLNALFTWVFCDAEYFEDARLWKCRRGQKNCLLEVQWLNFHLNPIRDVEDIIKKAESFRGRLAKYQDPFKSATLLDLQLEVLISKKHAINHQLRLELGEPYQLFRRQMHLYPENFWGTLQQGFREIFMPKR